MNLGYRVSCNVLPDLLVEIVICFCVAGSRFTNRRSFARNARIPLDGYWRRFTFRCDRHKLIASFHGRMGSGRCILLSLFLLFALLKPASTKSLPLLRRLLRLFISHLEATHDATIQVWTQRRSFAQVSIWYLSIEQAGGIGDLLLSFLGLAHELFFLNLIISLLSSLLEVSRIALVLLFLELSPSITLLHFLLFFLFQDGLLMNLFRDRLLIRMPEIFFGNDNAVAERHGQFLNLSHAPTLAFPSFEMLEASPSLESSLSIILPETLKARVFRFTQLHVINLAHRSLEFFLGDDNFRLRRRWRRRVKLLFVSRGSFA